MKLDPSDPKKFVPDDRLSVIDLKSTPPAVIATHKAGAGPSGIAINPAGTLALVANYREGTVSVFTISGKTLTAAGKIDLGDPKAGPAALSFTPDGKTALVTRDGDHRISILSDIAVIGNQGANTGERHAGDIAFRTHLHCVGPRLVSVTVLPSIDGRRS